MICTPFASADEAKDLPGAKRDFANADAALNKTYQVVCATLGKPQLADLREHQRQWIAYRDDLAGSWVTLGLDENADLTKSAEHWKMMADLTRDRTGFLKIFSGKGVSKGISGTYVDSFGGELELEQKKGGVAFDISVVRGHSAANGELTGLARLQGDKALFKDKPERGEDREPCEITLTFSEGRIAKLKGKNTSFYHGAAAFFDGTYFKTGELKEHIALDDAK